MTPDPDRLAELSAGLGRTLRCEVVLLWTPETPVPRQIAGSPAVAETWRTAMAGRRPSPLEQAFATARPVLERGSAAGTIRNGLCVPVVADGQVLAVIELLSADPFALDDVAIDLLASLGSLAGEAVEQRTENPTFLRTLLDSLREGVVACDADGRVTLFNRAFLDLAGDPEVPEALEALLRAMRGEEVRDAEVLLRPTRLVTANAGRMLDADGRVIGAVSVLHDVTEQRAAEERMADAEELAGAGAWELDLESREVVWSDGLCRLLGLEPGSVEPSEARLVAALHPDDRATAEARLATVVESGASQWETDYRVIRADGQVRRIHAVGRVLRDAAGQALRVRETLQDSTDRLEAEARLRRNEARARQSERMESLGQLAGGIAHDFNNLLAVIVNSSEFALDTLGEGSPERADVEEIRRAAERAADLTKRLLVFSRREVIRPQFVDLGLVVRGLEPLLERTLGENLSIEIQIGPGVGPVSADPGQLEQMLLNLALNARDAMPGGGTLRIEVDSVILDADRDDLGSGPYVRVRVSDTGAGMAPDVAARVFEPFFTTKPKGEGTGLGLATVYGVVSEAGGAISVKSAPGRGSTFTVHLPAAFGAPIGLREETGEPESTNGDRRRVLVVEDDAAVRRVSCRILRSAGYEVIEADDAEGAMRLLSEIDGEIDLLLTDVVMPGASGWDLHKDVSTRWPGIPTLFMSGYTNDFVAREDLSGDDIEFIAKPFAPGDLLGKVGGHAR